uniref:DDRGK domain containing 1 n=1 Tax=Coturnix japonica TaxID=93934 RepID=A0A8C2Y8T8_COTJA
MDAVLLAVVAVFLAVLLFFATRFHRSVPAAEEEHQQDVAAAVRPRPYVEERGDGMPRRRRNLGNRMMAQRRAQQAEEWVEEEDDAEEVPELQVTGKIGAKKQRKLEEKQARKAQREAEEAEREERRKLESKREEERRKEEERIRLEEERQVGLVALTDGNSEPSLSRRLNRSKFCDSKIIWYSVLLHTSFCLFCCSIFI